MFNLIDLIQHLANGIEALASIFKDMLLLRFFFIIGMSMELIYDFKITDKPLYTNIFWTVIIVLINVYQVFVLLYERGKLSFTHDELLVYHKVFSKMHKVNFKKLIKVGEWKDIPKDNVMIIENTFIDSLIFIFSGIAEVRVNNRLVGIIREGQFIGEMSYLTGSLTTATVTSLTDIRCITWPVDKLNDLIKKIPEIESGLNTVFNSDLIKKITIKNTE